MNFWDFYNAPDAISEISVTSLGYKCNLWDFTLVQFTAAAAASIYDLALKVVAQDVHVQNIAPSSESRQSAKTCTCEKYVTCNIVGLCPTM